MALITLVEDPEAVPSLLGWSRRLAAALGVERVVYCLLGDEDGEPVVRLRPQDPIDHPLVTAVRAIEGEGDDDAVRIYLLRKSEAEFVAEKIEERDALRSW